MPYSRSAYRRALVLNAMTDSLSVVAAAVILIAGLLFGALTLAVPLALIVYAGGATRAFFDDDTGRRVLDHERAKRRKALDRGTATLDLEFPLPASVTSSPAPTRHATGSTRRSTAPSCRTPRSRSRWTSSWRPWSRPPRRAQLLDEGLSAAPPATVASRLEAVRRRGHPSQAELVAALEYQLSVQRKMEKQLARFHDQMDRMLVELDTVRGNLISVSASRRPTSSSAPAGRARAP